MAKTEIEILKDCIDFLEEEASATLNKIDKEMFSEDEDIQDKLDEFLNYLYSKMEDALYPNSPNWK